jgi:hypothetical protein
MESTTTAEPSLSVPTAKGSWTAQPCGGPTVTVGRWYGFASTKPVATTDGTTVRPSTAATVRAPIFVGRTGSGLGTGMEAGSRAHPNTHTSTLA